MALCIPLFAIRTSDICKSEIPLWEYEKHFLEYHVRCLEGAIYRIDQQIKNLKENPENADQIIPKIELELDFCKTVL
jgi:hypothetical protein